MILAASSLAPPPAGAYFAGGGKDESKGNDCLVGYDGFFAAGDVVLDGKKQLVECTDCDPACDLDGVAEPNGSCTIAVGVCLNQSGVGGCEPADSLWKASAKGTVRGLKAADGGKIELDLEELLVGSACGAHVDVRIPLLGKHGPVEEGGAVLTLNAAVKKDKAAGVKARHDRDVLKIVCKPLRAEQTCPLAPTTSTSTTVVSTTTSTTLETTSTTVESTSTTSTTTETTSTTMEATTTSTSTTTSTVASTSSTTSTTPTTVQTTSTTSTSVASTSTTSTSTSSSSSSSSSVPTTSSTSSTAATTSSTSTSLATTSSTTSTSTTTATSSTTSTTISPLCGNGQINPGESCDDGNNVNNDTCPADCTIDACVQGTTTRTATVSFAPPQGLEVAAVTPLVDYPEGRVTVPGSGQMTSSTFTPLYPPTQVLIRGFDLDHAVRGLVASSEAVPAGAVFQIRFTDCVGAQPPTAADFGCEVVDAFDVGTNPVPGVICSVSLP